LDRTVRELGSRVVPRPGLQEIADGRGLTFLVTAGSNYDLRNRSRRLNTVLRQVDSEFNVGHGRCMIYVSHRQILIRPRGWRLTLAAEVCGQIYCSTTPLR
jgi:hypothetical protein